MSRSVEVGGVGRFIVVEGIDGSGKTSIAQRIHKVLLGILPVTPFFTREPTDPGVISLLRGESDHRVRMLLYLADRGIHVSRIRQALSDGHWVICDRYLHSTLVYNPVPVVDGSMDWDQFQRFVIWCAGGLLPDLTIWLDCPVEEALRRIAERGGSEPMYDRRLLSEARDRYEQLMLRLPGVVRVDASGGIDSVVGRCMEHIAPLIEGSASWSACVG